MKKYEPAQISGIIPIGAWDAEGNYGILRDGTIIDFLQIRCKNLYNASDAELAYDNIKWDKLFMTYPSDLKYIALNFPLDVSLQISYTKKSHKEPQTRFFFLCLRLNTIGCRRWPKR